MSLKTLNEKLRKVLKESNENLFTANEQSLIDKELDVLAKDLFSDEEIAELPYADKEYSFFVHAIDNTFTVRDLSHNISNNTDYNNWKDSEILEVYTYLSHYNKYNFYTYDKPQSLNEMLEIIIFSHICKYIKDNINKWVKE